MSENTKIEWATHTFNPWEGCQKVGPGCDNCYAESRNARFAGGAAVNWGPGAPRRRTSAANWRQPLAWNAAHEAFFAANGHRQRVFCSSLADVFDNAVDPTWRDDLFTLIGNTPNLDWLLLTKRIGNAKTMLPWVPGYTGPEGQRTTNVWRNVWIGATIVNQEEADRDIPKLLAVPAAKRFLSMEPLLGPVDLSHLNKDCETNEINALKPDAWEEEITVWRDTDDEWEDQFEDWYGVAPKDATGAMHPGVDWVIVGGESGPNARPMHPQWALDLRDQCAAAGVPYLFKQWGEWAPHRAGAGGDEGVDLRQGHVRYLQGDGREPDGHFRKGDAAVACIGKKAASRQLDGITHDGVPAEAVQP